MRRSVRLCRLLRGLIRFLGVDGVIGGEMGIGMNAWGVEGGKRWVEEGGGMVCSYWALC